MSKEKQNAQINNDPSLQSVPYCVKTRELCYKCGKCEATYLELPNGQITFYKCGCF